MLGPQWLAKKLIRKYGPSQIIPYVKYLSSKGRIPFKNIVVENTLPVGRVLVIAPHPDDEVIGIGGAISMHVESQSKVTVLYMTDGRHAHFKLGVMAQETIKLRRQDAESIAQKYHFDPIFWNVEDSRLTNDVETISEMVKVLKDTQPTIIYLPSFFDYQFDHFSANQVLLEALKQTSPSEVTICGYEVWNNIPYPNYLLDISEHFEKKLEMLSNYAISLKDIDYGPLCEARNRLNYYLYIKLKMHGYAEAFYRLDFATYQELYHDYAAALKQYGSMLPRNIISEQEDLQSR